MRKAKREHTKAYGGPSTGWVHRPVTGYAIAVVGTGLGVLASWLLGAEVTDVSPFLAFYPVVVASSATGGTGPGLVATFLTTVAAIFFMEPRGRFVLPSSGEWVALGLYVAINSATSVLGGRLRSAHQRTHASEAYYRASFQETDIGMGRVSFADARWIDVNQAFCRMLGYTREEMLATPWPHMTHPEDVELDLVPFRQLSAGELETYTVEKRFIHKQGHHVWARLTLSLVRDIDNSPDYEIAVIEDITPRKEAEQALRERQAVLDQLLSTPTFGVLFFDLSGRMTEVNDQLLRMTGYAREEFLAIPDWHVLTPPEFYEVTSRAAHQIAMTGETLPYEKQWIRKDGSRFWGLFAPARLSGNGMESRCIEFTIDITERKQAEKALRAAKKSLAQTNAELDRKVRERTARLQDTLTELEQISYSMIHDLRAPLRAIRSFGDIISNDPDSVLTEQSRELIHKMGVASQRMDHLVRDVLAYNRVVREELPLVPIDVGALAHGIVDTYPDLRASGAEIRIAPDLPQVIGNPAALTQCLSQILSNAVKFTKPGQPPNIQITGEKKENGWSRILVQDNGIGFAPELRDKVFGIFQQLRNTATGTGMGLAIVRKAVERMGGRVGVDSEPGQGSRFWIELRTAIPVRLEHEQARVE